MITRQLDSEFGHEVTISVEWEAPQNNSEFPLVYVGMWRRGHGDQHMWLSEREAQALKRMLIELLCPKAFDALIEADDSPDDGAWPFSRDAIRQLISTDECGRGDQKAGGEQERLCQTCGDWLTDGYERYCAGCYRANEAESAA